MNRIATYLPTRVTFCFVTLLLSSKAYAQVSDFYNPEESEKAKKANAVALKKMLNLPDPKPIEPNPSRYSGAETKEYVLARAAVFSMRERDEDPFMFIQDTTAKPKEKKVAPRKQRTRNAALPPTPLADIIKLINVTTIMPSEKKFLVGIRSFKESEEFPLQYQEKTIKIKVVSVTARKIVFRDLDNDEEATLETQMLPPGMVAGGGELQPPGMLSEGSDLPLMLGKGDEPPSPNN